MALTKGIKRPLLVTSEHATINGEQHIMYGEIRRWGAGHAGSHGQQLLRHRDIRRFINHTRGQADAIRKRVQEGTAQALRDFEAKVATCAHTYTRIIDIPDAEDEDGRLIDGGLQVRCATCDSVRDWL